MSRKQYKDTDYSYEIFDDGYDIYYKDIKHVEQHDPYGKVFIPDGTYEENCLTQLDQMSVVPTPEPGPIPIPPTQEEIDRADIDYIALMEDLELPSYKTDEEVTE